MNLEYILKIVNYGKYSKSFVNYVIEFTQDKDIKRYLKILKIKRVVKNHELLEKVDEEIKKCKNTGVKYLLLKMKLNIVGVLKDTELNRELYYKLIREFGKIPISCRNMIGKSLKMDNAYNYERASKDFRTWSKDHIKDDLDIALELNAVAIKYSRKKEYAKASKVYYCVFKNALKYPHPTYIVAGLNNSAWYEKFIDVDKAFEISNELAYYLGYYLEYVHSIIGYLDTILNILKMRNDYFSYYTVAKILVFYYETLAKDIPQIREKYKKTMYEAKKYCLLRKKRSSRKDEVSNGKDIQKFLKERIKKPRAFAAAKGLSHASIYRILNGEKETVKIKTLIQIIDALELDWSFENPKAINFAILQRREQSLFESNSEKLKLLSPFDLKLLVVKGIFVQLPNKSVDYLKLLLLAEDVEKFKDYANKYYSVKEFINRCIKSDYSYYSGREILFKNLINELKNKNSLSELVNLYASVRKIDDMEQLNIYFREYMRYSTTDWNFDVEEVLENRFSDPDYDTISSFCEKLKLSEIHGYICTWFFEGEDRNRLLKMFSANCV